MCLLISAKTAPLIEDTILPDLKCPLSQTIILSQETKHVTLEGAESQDNLGLKVLKYKPQIEESSATYQPPYTLTLTKKSVGYVYPVLVTAMDYSGNEAVCSYTITVKGRYSKYIREHGKERLYYLS